MSEIASLRRRLAEVNRAPSLPAMSRYTLATSTLSDDELEMAIEPFGAPANESGFGMAELLHDLMTREPLSVPVEDITKLQAGLVDTGYATGVQPDGVWSPYWYSAFRRSDRDAKELVREGGHWTSATTAKFFEYLGHTVPTAVFQSLAGMAEGILEQALTAAKNPVETAEEAGLAGGVATGAVVGGTIGGVPGALIGGGIGGVVSFAADFFGDDEGEEDQSFWDKVWDSLSPYDEVKAGGAKNFFALLDTVMVASGILKGVKLAATGTKAAWNTTVTGAGGLGFPTVQAGAKEGLRAALTMAGKGTVAPGIAAKMASRAVRRPMLGGAATGFAFEALPEFLQGDFEEGVQEGLKGAAIGAAGGAIAKKIVPQKAVDKTLEALDAAPLRRALGSPAGKIAQSVYTGASVAGMSGRVFGGLGSGKDLTPIEEGIENAPDLGGFGTALDLTIGTLIYPERLLPWRARDLGKAFTEISSGHAMIPFAQNAQRTVQNGQVVYLSFREGLRRARTALGVTPNGFDEAHIPLRMTYGYLQFGIDKAARQALRGKGFTDEWDEAAAFAQERLKVTRSILKDPDAANRLYREAVEDPWGMRNYLDSFEGKKTSIENFADHQRAVEVLQRETAARRGADESFSFTPAVKGQYQTRQDFESLATRYENTAKAHLEAWKKSAKIIGGEDDALVSAGRALDDTLVEMRDRKMIDEETFRRLRQRDQTGTPLFDPSIPGRLREVAQTRAPEIPEATAALTDAGLDRYIGIQTSEDMLRYDHIQDMMEITGVSEYTRRQGFFDLLHSFVAKPDETMQLGTARYHEIAAQLDLAAAELGMDETGKQLANRINKGLRARYDIDAARDRGENVSAWGPVVKREDATGKVKRELFKVDPRDLTPDDLINDLGLDQLDDPYEAAQRIKRAVHVGAAFGADVMKFPMHPLQQARALARGMKLTGLPAFNDFMRTTYISPRGMLEAMDKVPVLRREVAEQAGKRKPYWYLPNRLHRVSMAARYSLSPTFDIGRYIEQSSLGVYRGEIPIMASMAPRRFLANRKWSSSPYSSDAVSGDEAVKDAMKFYDEEILGRTALTTFDELQMRLMHRGVLGFSPRQAEAAQAWYLYQRAAKKGPVSASEIEDIRTAVFEIGRYGTGQSPLAKSAHLVFFPLLFQMKMFRHLHDFVLGAPVRNLMIHEGFRQWYSVNDQGESMSSQFSEFMEKHIPIADELARLNNLSFGLGPGRFFLEGIADQSAVGKVGQALTAFFVPGGSHQPLQEFVGSASAAAGRSVVPDSLKHLFVPVVVTDATPAEQLLDTFERLVPAWRDAQNFIFGYESKSGGHVPGALTEQFTALPVIGEGAAPMWQMDQYNEAKQQIDVELEAMLGEPVKAMGYESVDSFLQSDAGAPMKELVNRLDNELGAIYPSGKEIANRFVNSTEIKEQYIYNLSRKPERTEAEDLVVAIGEAEAVVRSMAEQVGVTQEDALRAVAPILRGLAVDQIGNPQFRQLWDQWFTYQYGPIAQVADQGRKA